jgi:hypothetical protein
MIENESRTRQAIRGIKQMFRDDGAVAEAARPADAAKSADAAPIAVQSPNA